MTTLLSRSKTTSRIAIVALAVSMPIFGTAFANTESGATQASEQKSAKMKHHKGNKGERNLFNKKIIKRLALTDEQVVQIDAIKAQAKLDAAPYKEAKKSFMEKKKAIMKQTPFDQTALEILQQEYQTTFSEARLLQSKNQHAMMNVLNEEQKAKLIAMKKKHEGKNRGKGKERKANKEQSTDEQG